MALSGINGYSNWWQWQSQATQGSTSAAGTPPPTVPSDSIVNTGSIAAGNVTDFMQAFSADLQSMLAQLGDEGSTSATATGSTATATSQTDPTQSTSVSQHHHHHHAHGGEGGSMDDTASQLVGEIGQSLQGGSLTAGQISQSASLFATDVEQALQSYGVAAPTPTTSSGISTVA